MLFLLPPDLLPEVCSCFELNDLQNLEDAVQGDERMRIALRASTHHLHLVTTDPLDSTSIAYIARNAIRIANIYLRNALSTDEIDILSQYAKDASALQVRLLEESSSWFTNDMLLSIASSCPKLMAVSLLNCLSLTPVSVCILAQRCPNINAIALSENAISDAVLSKLGESCTTLEHLYLFNASGVSEYGFRSLSPGCTMLRNIYVSYLFSTLGLATVLHYTPQLLSCEVSGWNIDDTILFAISQHCRNIQILKLCGATSVTASGLIAIAKHCKRIQELELVYALQLINDGVEALAMGCPLLTKIGLINCTKLTDSATCALVRHCAQLEQFSINNNMLSLTSTLSDASLLSIADFTPQLQVLRCGGTNITDIGLCSMAKRCCNLFELSLTRCSNITDASLVCIAEYCHVLVQVSVAYCTNISDAGIAAIVNSCKKLRVMNLCNCELLTSASLEVMINALVFSPEKLNIAKCTHMSVESIIQFLFSLRNQAQVTIDVLRYQLIKKFHHRFPHISIIAIDTDALHFIE